MFQTALKLTEILSIDRAWQVEMLCETEQNPKAFLQISFEEQVFAGIKYFERTFDRKHHLMS